MSITKISPSVVDFDAGITISTTDNSDNLTLTSTDADANSGPNLLLKRDNNSAAGDDVTGTIVFQAEDAGNNLTDYIAFKTMIQDATGGSEDGRLKLELMSGGTARNILDISGSNAVVFNEDSQDIDFRVESDANTNALFVDGGQNAIGIQTATEHDGTALVYPLTINAGNHSGNALEVHRTTNSRGYWYASDTGTHYLDVYGSSSPNLRFRVAGSDVAKVTSAGICFGSDTAAANALDDYEEGTWSPTLGGGSTTGSVAYSGQLGYYVKIGQLVYAYFDISISSASGMVGESILSLPITSINANVYGAFVPWDCDTAFFDSGKLASGYVYPNSTYLKLYQTDGTTGHNIGNTWKVNQTGRISGSVTYLTAT